jgi:hypothetical protein
VAWRLQARARSPIGARPRTEQLTYDLAVPNSSEDGLKREPPDVTTLLGLLSEAGVNYVVTGSAAAMLHGVPLVPGDLDITPALDVDNLTRLAAVLESIEARQDPGAPFGHWKRGDDGEQHWIKTPPTRKALAQRASWKPDPADPTSFDYLLRSRHGALDVVPQVSGTYDELIGRAVAFEIDGIPVWVESVEDLLATLTTPRRAKDRDRVGQLRALQRAAAAGERPSAEP